MISDVRAQKDLLQMVMGDGGRAVLDNFDAGLPSTDFPDVQLLHAERFRIMRGWSEFFTAHPILLAPTWAQPAFAHGADIADGGDEMMVDTIRPVVHATLLGLPAAVVPVGISDGLPVGVQVVAPFLEDRTALDVARRIEARLGGFAPPSAFA